MIEINNLTTVHIDENLLKKIIKEILKEEKVKKESGLSIALVGPGIIIKLNKIYRQKNRATDILSFPESKIEMTRADPFQQNKSLGEIVICLREVKKNAQRYKSDFKAEFLRVLIHGVLHLLGYDHEKSEKESRKMEEKQNFYLSKFLNV